MNKQPVYKNAGKPEEVRVRDLMKRMTLQEKIGQLCSTTPISQLMTDDYTDDRALASGKALVDRGIGQIGVVVRHAEPAAGARIANELQRYAREETRLGIPVLIQDECVHGCKANGSTMFPMSIGLAAAWDTGLMERVVEVIGREVKARGINQCYSPTLNIGRDVRCGRTEETFGEDPYLVTRMGVAFVKTLQRHGLAATPKHFVANFVGDGGRDSHPMHISERLLREIYFPAFRAAVEEAKAMSLMISHTAIDGIPCANNKWLMQEIIRDEWGFDGFIVPDNTDVQKNVTVHAQCETFAESCKRCIEAGLDTDMSWTPPEAILCYIDHLPKLVKTGKVSLKSIDACVARVLRIKFRLGLFDNPYVDEGAARMTQSPDHRAVARESARAGMVLLKNEGLLPFTGKTRRIAVIGPSAKKARLGGYTCANPNSVSPFDGIKNRLGDAGEVWFAEGCKLTSTSKRGFDKAVAAARHADAVVVCVGNSSDKVIGQPETTEGERHDRCNLDLPGVQEDLILELARVNRNIVVVLQNGSAITMMRWLPHVKAVLEAWYPGAEGGHAIADILFGDYNPAGRLPITFPRFSGQLPLYYNPRPHGRVPDYCDMRGKQALFEFGYGLSYTTFTYRDLRVSVSGAGRRIKVRIACNVTNSGRRAGDEVVQLYIRDVYSSVTRPILELKRFERISLKRGETGRVTFTLGFDDLMHLDPKLKPVLEPGDFKIMVGASSEDIRLERTIRL